MNRTMVALVCSLMSLSAIAQPYPSRLVKVIVPYPAGSTPDIVARTLSSKLQAALGQPFVVENRAGAGGNIGTETVAKSPPDGHTQQVAVNGPVAVNKFNYKDMPFDPDRDLLPISLLSSSPQMLVVMPSLGVENFKDFIGHARANPGRLS